MGIVLLLLLLLVGCGLGFFSFLGFFFFFLVLRQKTDSSLGDEKWEWVLRIGGRRGEERERKRKRGCRDGRHGDKRRGKEGGTEGRPSVLVAVSDTNRRERHKSFVSPAAYPHLQTNRQTKKNPVWHGKMRTPATNVSKIHNTPKNPRLSFIHPHFLIHFLLHPFKLSSNSSLIHSFSHPIRPSSIHSFIHSFSHPFRHACIDSFIHSFTYLSIHSFMLSHTHPFLHSSVHSFIRLFKRSHGCPFIHPFFHPFIHPIMHPFIHSFIPHRGVKPEGVEIEWKWESQHFIFLFYFFSGGFLALYADNVAPDWSSISRWVIFIFLQLAYHFAKSGYRPDMKHKMFLNQI